MRRWAIWAVVTCLPHPDAGALHAQEAFTLADEPTLRVGSLDDPATAFSRIVSVVSMSDGGVVVADGGAAELRRFGPDGALLWTAGREGGGPGEFQSLARVAVGPSDSLWAWDFSGNAISVFDAEGGFARSFRLGPPAGVVGRGELVGMTGEGRLVVGWHVDGDGAGEGYRLWYHDASGMPSERIAVAPGRLIGSDASGGMQFDVILPWGSMPVAAVGARSVFLGHGSEPVVTRYARAGETAMPHPAPPRRPVSDDVVDAFIEQMVSGAPAAIRDRLAARMAPMREAPRPDHLPFLSSLVADPTGGVWVERFHVPGSSERVWDRFDDTGSWLGEVRVPANLTILQHRGDALVGWETDEFEVQYAVVYRIG